MTAFKRSSHRPLARRLALVGTVTAAGLFLAACGGNGDDMNGMDHGNKSSPAATQDPAANPAPGAFNDTDVKFAQSMIPHHQQALEMAKLAGGRAADQEVKTLATAIEKAQDPEIQTMKSWLKAWGKPESADSSMPGMDHGTGDTEGSGMSGMMSEKDMEELKAAKGTDFDKKFAQMMTDHHNGAIEMAKDEQKNGRNATAKKLADDVVKNQSAEVQQLRKILDRL
ncbi:DUF305 domain-containing protein [Streptomyces sp. ISL-96]|uniref:DUF305 domain-containing protein n=1 Tax=Streptomyces sp. ISL-96 TaxID=2819191 RepID=UPI001BE75481|nr:DUF305 domain-containing protein [Streptomyces sp. ISL-96]MBT2492896.1 DUF305 domain-containing protein [Streptomyces sp. ISL-96]